MKHVSAGLLVCLALCPPPDISALELRPVELTMSQQPDGTLQLSWQTQSMITNTGCTPVFPEYRVQVSSDLAYWWDTGLRVPLRVGGLPMIVQTNFIAPPVFPLAFIRVQSKIDFRGVDFSNADFHEVDFTGQDFTGARFDRATLSGTIFSNAILNDVQMNYVAATGALCYAAQAQRLVATNSNFSEGMWLKAVLTDAVLNSSTFTNNNMRHANMDNVKAARCSFWKVVFNSNSMESGDFTGSKFKSGSFINANIDHAAFGDADLDNVSFDDVHGEYSYFYGAILTDTIFEESDFSYTDFRTANFEDSQWKYTDFRFCDFRGTDLDGVFYWGCDFAGADFWGPP